MRVHCSGRRARRSPESDVIERASAQREGCRLTCNPTARLSGISRLLAMTRYDRSAVRVATKAHGRRKGAAPNAVRAGMPRDAMPHRLGRDRQAAPSPCLPALLGGSEVAGECGEGQTTTTVRCCMLARSLDEGPCLCPCHLARGAAAGTPMDTLRPPRRWTTGGGTPQATAMLEPPRARPPA